MRNIIQIAAASTGNGELFALCDDGTLWRLIWTSSWKWILMPDVPQEEGKK